MIVQILPQDLGFYISPDTDTACDHHVEYLTINHGDGGFKLLGTTIVGSSVSFNFKTKEIAMTYFRIFDTCLQGKDPKIEHPEYFL